MIKITNRVYKIINIAINLDSVKQKASKKFIANGIGNLARTREELKPTVK